MEINSPRPEHLQLSTSAFAKADVMLNTLNRRVQFASQEHNDGNLSKIGSEPSTGSAEKLEVNQSSFIDCLLDDRSIPSPPLSPKFNVSSNEQYNTKEDNIENIIVSPTWSKEQTVKRYRYYTQGFLSQYRIFKSENNSRLSSYNSTLPSNYSRPKRSNRLHSGSDIERHYRTRRATKEPNTIFEEDIEIPFTKSEHSFSKTVLKSPKKTFSPPLASTSAVHGNSVYTPNMSWEKLPDYAPPVSTLPANNVKCLKIEWKGSPMNLSNDPLQHLLHPAELILAQVLRLPCDLYLDSKRRFFLEKVYRYKKCLPFRRTDAQKACKIDVNKASRLYAAFEKVGWLKDKHFEKYL